MIQKTKNDMKKRVSLVFIVVAVLATVISCGKKEKQAVKQIPDKDLINILTDTYIADGLMNITKVRDMYRYRDSTVNYIEVAGSYGYTTSQIDSTLKYYFIHKPKKLEKIFDAVTGRLLEMQTRLENSDDNGTTSSTKTNLWNGASSYSFLAGSATDSVAFNIPVKSKGLYIFRATYTLFPDDESINPVVVINFSNINDKGKETISDWERCMLTKDGKPHSIELKKELTDNNHAFIKGFLFHQVNKGDGWKKHATITDINIDFIPSEKDEVLKR